MKLFDIIVTANRSIWRSRIRTILTVSAVIVGSIGLTLSLSLGNGTNKFVDTISLLFASSNEITITKKLDVDFSVGGGFGTQPRPYVENSIGNFQLPVMSQSDIDTLAEVSEITELYPQPFRAANLVYLEYDDQKLVGTDEFYRGTASDAFALQVGDLKDLVGTDTIVLGNGFADAYDMVPAELIDQTVSVVFNNVIGERITRELTVVGVMEQTFFNGDLMLLPADLESELNSFANVNSDSSEVQYISATALFDDSLTTEQVDELKDKLDDLGFTAQTSADITNQIREVITIVQTVLVMFSSVIIFVALFGVTNTLIMSVYERTQEIGLMKALGLRTRTVFVLFALEATLIGVWGSLGGYVVGIILGNWLNGIATTSLFAGLSVFTPFQYATNDFLIIVLVISLICTIAGVIPAIMAARLDPIEALKRE